MPIIRSSIKLYSQHLGLTDGVCPAVVVERLTGNNKILYKVSSRWNFFKIPVISITHLLLQLLVEMLSAKQPTPHSSALELCSWSSRFEYWLFWPRSVVTDVIFCRKIPGHDTQMYYCSLFPNRYLLTGHNDRPLSHAVMYPLYMKERL
jgi:hypothetical protein